MAKILLTWETGSNLGHEIQVTTAALILHAAGHEVVIYAPHNSHANSAALAAHIRWEQIPALPEHHPASPNVEWHSRATALWSHGFHSVNVIRNRLSAWSGVFRAEKPHVAVLQAAPFAQVASHLHGIPSLEFGIGFDVPPREHPFPAFRNPNAFSTSVAIQLEQTILNRIHTADEGTKTFSALSDISCGTRRLIITLPELDHYAGHKDETREFVGPLPLIDMGGNRPQWTKGKPRILAYLRADLLDAPTLLHALATLRSDCVLVCFNADEETLRLAKSLNVRIYGGAISMLDLLPKADLVISHGGGGLIAASIAMGHPCLVFPTQYEQFMTGTALMRQGIGVMVNPKEPAQYARALQHALTAPQIQHNTKIMATRHRGHSDKNSSAFLQVVESLAKLH